MRELPSALMLSRIGLVFLLALSIIGLPDQAEARSRKHAPAKGVKKHHKAPSAKRGKRATLVARPSAPTDAAQTLLAEPEPQEAGESGLHGAASFYGHGFQGRKVASGERFDVQKMTAASNRFPLGTWLAVRRLDTGACVVVRVNDRMHVKHRVRIIDLSRGAAERLKMISAGVVLVRVVPLAGPPSGDGEDAACLNAFASRLLVPEGTLTETERLPETTIHERPSPDVPGETSQTLPENPGIRPVP